MYAEKDYCRQGGREGGREGRRKGKRMCGMEKCVRPSCIMIYKSFSNVNIHTIPWPMRERLGKQVVVGRRCRKEGGMEKETVMQQRGWEEPVE